MKSPTSTAKEPGKNLKWVGILLVLLTNFCYMGNNYIVKWSELSASEVSLVRGTLQILVFSIVLLRTRKNSDNKNVSDEEEALSGKIRVIGQSSVRENLLKYFLVNIFGCLNTSIGFTMLAAVALMPISDLIVLCYTAPVFSVFMDTLVLKRPLKIITVSLCLILVIGEVLAVQPEFLFAKNDLVEVDENMTFPIIEPGEEPTEMGMMELSNDDLDHSESKKTSSEEFGGESHKQIDRSSSKYIIGVCLCLYAAIASAAINVFQVFLSKKYENSVTKNHLITVTGFWNVIFSVMSLPVLSNRVLTSPLSMSTLTISMLLSSSLITVSAVWFMLTAVAITQNPTLVTMWMSTEICISLVTEAIYWHQLPNFISVVGSVLVMFSVGGIAAADDIKKFFCKKETEDENQTSNVDIDQKYCDTYLNTNLPQKEKLLTLEASSIEEETERKP